MEYDKLEDRVNDMVRNRFIPDKVLNSILERPQANVTQKTVK
jgi:hypothetical protein